MTPTPGWFRPILILVGLLVVYYTIPVEVQGSSPAVVVLSLLGTIGGLALVGTVMVRELGAVRRGDAGRGAQVLSMLLILLVMAASLSFFLLNEARPDQVSGLETRTDALYFTLSTMTTVGYGDVHAAGQVARALVCVLIAFNVVVVTSLVRAYTSRGRNDQPAATAEPQ